MKSIANFCLGVMFIFAAVSGAATPSQANDLGLRYKLLWTNAKWESRPECGAAKKDLMDKVIKKIDSDSAPEVHVVSAEFEPYIDSENECRVARKGFFELANKDICEAMITANRMTLILHDRPFVSVRLQCMGTSGVGWYKDVKVGL